MLGGFRVEGLRCSTLGQAANINHKRGPDREGQGGRKLFTPVVNLLGTWLGP